MNDEGEYHIRMTEDPRAWFIVPDSHRVFVDGGCLIIYDENDQIILSVASGHWIEIISNSIFEKLHPVFPMD